MMFTTSFKKEYAKKIKNVYITFTSVMKMHTIHLEGCGKFITVVEIGSLHT